MKRILIAAALSIFMSHTAHAELVISTAGMATTITFDSTLAGSNNGQFTGDGIGNAVGQLDGTSWAITGMSSASDLSRGTSNGDENTGGVYAFNRGSGTPNHFLGIQPGGSDFTDGDITLLLKNNTGSTLSDFDIAYDIYTRNDQNRANSLNFSYSLDGSSFVSVGALDYTTPEARDVPAGWEATNRTLNIVQEINAGSNLWLRWTGDDVSGSFSRDEYGIDDISITFNTATVPEPTSFMMFGAVIVGYGFRRRRK